MSGGWLFFYFLRRCDSYNVHVTWMRNMDILFDIYSNIQYWCTMIASCFQVQPELQAADSVRMEVDGSGDDSIMPLLTDNFDTSEIKVIISFMQSQLWTHVRLFLAPWFEYKLVRAGENIVFRPELIQMIVTYWGYVSSVVQVTASSSKIIYVF